MLRWWRRRSARLNAARSLGCLSILVVIGWQAHHAVGQPTVCDSPVTLVNLGTTGGDSVIGVDAGRLQTAPDWKPGGDEPPISTGKAVAAVKEWVKLNAPEIEPVAVQSVYLRSVACEPLAGRWFYVVQNASIAPGAQPKSKMAAVLMDGSVVAGQGPNPDSPSTYAQLPSSLVTELYDPKKLLRYDGPPDVNLLSLIVVNMLRVEKFEQLEADLSKVLDDRKQLPDGRLAYSVVMLGVDNMISYGDQQENLLKQIRRWSDRIPRSRHASIVEALYWRGYAWYARGSGYANAVSEKGWELYRERTALAVRALEEGREYAGVNPFWQSVNIYLAWDQNRPLAEIWALYADAVRRDPWFPSSYFAMAYRMTPRWGGNIVEYRKFVEDAVKRTTATDGATMYARLYAVYADTEYYDQKFADLGIPWSKMKTGFEDLIARYPTPRNVNLYARFACQANDKQAFLKLLPKLTPKDLRPDEWTSGYNLDNCKEMFTVRT